MIICNKPILIHIFLNVLLRYGRFKIAKKKKKKGSYIFAINTNTNNVFK